MHDKKSFSLQQADRETKINKVPTFAPYFFVPRHHAGQKVALYFYNPYNDLFKMLLNNNMLKFMFYKVHLLSRFHNSYITV